MSYGDDHMVCLRSIGVHQMDVSAGSTGASHKGADSVQQKWYIVYALVASDMADQRSDMQCFLATALLALRHACDGVPHIPMAAHGGA